MKRRTILAGAALLPCPAFAQDRPLRLVVPFAPGGTSDILARVLVPGLSQALGQAVVVENRSGAAGNLGAELVARSAPDGQTLLLTDTGALATAPALFARLAFDPLKDLAPVKLLAYSPYILAVHPGVPAADAAAFAALVRRAPDSLNVAHSGVGAANHLTALLLAQHWGAALTMVPYRGGAAALAAVTGGEAQVIVNGATATAPFCRDGRLRALAVSGAHRLLDVPRFAELGWPAPDSGTYQGVLAAGGTPPAVLARLEAALRTALAPAEMARRFDQLGLVLRGEGTEEFRTWLAAEAAEWGRIVRANNITAE